MDGTSGWKVHRMVHGKRGMAFFYTPVGIRKAKRKAFLVPGCGISDVAKLGHTGARALATGGCAPPVQALLKIIGAECTVINRELGAKSAQRC